MKVKMIFSYKGTNYFGYAKQVNQITIQEVIETKLSIILNEEINIKASGRTDKGVHALNQVCDFIINDESIDLNKLKYRLNKFLPNDIYIKSIEKVNDDFSSRLSAKSKTYLYVITKEYSPFYNDLALYFTDINIDKINECLSLFIGKHDFKNFTSKESDTFNFIRTINSFELIEKDNFLVFEINGDGFMRYMVRKIIGTILEVSKSNIDKSFIINNLNSSDREIITYTALPHALYLSEVFY